MSDKCIECNIRPIRTVVNKNKPSTLVVYPPRTGAYEDAFSYFYESFPHPDKLCGCCEYERRR